MAFGRPAVLAALAVLCGCSVIPEYEEPVVDSPAGWRQLPAADAARAEPPGPGWWRAFGSDELTRLVADARRNNPDLQAATSRIAQAAAARRATGAALLPTVGASASAARSGQDLGAFGTAGDRRAFDAAFDASYEVDLWGRNRAGLLAAEAVELATGFERETVALTLTADVAGSYLQYLAFGDRLAVARANLDNASRILDLVETRARLGATSALEVAQQRSALASLQASLRELEQQRAQAEHGIAALLGEPPVALRLQAEGLQAVRLPAVSPGLPSELLTRRPDIRRAEAQLIAANADIGAARAALFPSVRLTAQGGFASAALSSLLDPASAFYRLAAGLAAPIFEGGRLRAEEDRARARYDELLATYRGAIVAAFRDVEDALAAVRYLAEVEAAQRRAAAQAREAYRLAELQYRGGAVDFLTVLDAQRSLLASEDALVRTRLARLTAAVSLYRALGGGWTGPGGGPTGWNPI